MEHISKTIKNVFDMIEESMFTGKDMFGLDTRVLESPPEELFYSNVAPYVEKMVSLMPQFVVETSGGGFRLDFVLENQDKKIAIEIDGAEFHKDTLKDDIRDAYILNESDVSEIVRFKAKDILFHLDDCLWALSVLHPELINERGRHRYERLKECSNSTEDIVERLNDNHILLYYRNESRLDPNVTGIIIHTKEYPWIVSKFEYAVAHGHGSTQELSTRWRQQHYKAYSDEK